MRALVLFLKSPEPSQIGQRTNPFPPQPAHVSTRVMKQTSTLNDNSSFLVLKGAISIHRPSPSPSRRRKLACSQNPPDSRFLCIADIWWEGPPRAPCLFLGRQDSQTLQTIPSACRSRYSGHNGRQPRSPLLWRRWDFRSGCKTCSRPGWFFHRMDSSWYLQCGLYDRDGLPGGRSTGLMVHGFTVGCTLEALR